LARATASIPHTTHGEAPLLLAPALAMESEPTLAEVVEPCRGRGVFRCGPVEAVGFQSRILAGIGAPAAQHRVEARAASDQERRVRPLPAVVRVLADAAVASRELPPILLRRESPSASQREAPALGRLPRVQASIPAAVQRRVLVAIEGGGVEVQVLD